MKRGALPLNALRAFEATARNGKMTLAADELGVTYGAISRQVRSLEEMLGVTLFEGPRNRLRPTDAAEDLLPSLTDAFDGIEAAVNRVTGQEKRLLDISCFGTFVLRWLIPRLYDFQNRHPAIEVRLTSEDIPVDFRRHKMDIAIRSDQGGQDQWGDATITPLLDDLVGPVVSPSLVPEGGFQDPAALAALPILHTKTRPGAWPKWCAAVGASLPLDGQNFEHFYFLLEAATAGLGVAIAPHILVQDDLRAGRLVAPFGFIPSGIAYVALSPPNAGKDSQAFLSWLQAMAAA